MSIVPVYVGLDYHDETIRVCVMNAEGEVLANRNVDNDPGAVRDLVRQHGGLVRGVALEACCGAADFATQLIELTEWTVRLAHPSAVNRLKQGRTNRITRTPGLWPTCCGSVISPRSGWQTRPRGNCGGWSVIGPA